MKKMESMMHSSLHQGLQTRPPALKDNKCWTSQLLWFSIFSAEKEGTFFPPYSSVMLRIYNEMMLGKSQFLIQRRSPRKLRWMWLWLSGTHSELCSPDSSMYQNLLEVLLKYSHLGSIHRAPDSIDWGWGLVFAFLTNYQILPLVQTKF